LFTARQRASFNAVNATQETLEASVKGFATLSDVRCVVLAELRERSHGLN